MNTFVVYILLSGCFLSIYSSSNFFAIQQDFGYVDVRDKAHMFWWLQYTQSMQGYQQVPLIMWLQGGPGGSSTGFGNFMELGPLDVNMNPRNTTWLKLASLLYVDNPVGAGYSYVDSDDALTTDVSMIAADMIVLLTTFFNSPTGKNFQNVPFYIFCESYGGKMTAAISKSLYQNMNSGKIKVNFKGLALGDSWISPVDSTVNWAPYILTNSIIDEKGFYKINEATVKMTKMIEGGMWKEATTQWGVIQDILETESNGVNFYNMLAWGGSEAGLKSSNNLKERMINRMIGALRTDKLTALMNGEVKKMLNIPEKVEWGAQSSKVFMYQAEDFMKPVVDIVDYLIQNTSLSVVVYTGQLDIIVATPGTEKWITQLGIYKDYYNATRQPLYDPYTKLTTAFYKSVKNFSVYWILDAGHMVPMDNGNAALEMVKRIISK
ncbi:retinoid-inducible serine carboxypeptidase-like [Mytilus trossulus]|uniref:retinoid-inducible serine carboxypeptidase-like n=1 Tax=Mytilus trossulus TaxID=6551 RepID=UPI003004C859